MDIGELAVQFAENCAWRRTAKIENNILELPDHYVAILNDASNPKILYFLRQSLVYFLIYCKPISIRSKFGDSVYTIFEGLKQQLRIQIPFKFDAALYLKNLNWFSRNERMENCLPFLFETNRPGYAAQWLRDVTNGMHDGFIAQTHYMDTNKFDCFVEATKASLIFLQIELTVCVNNDYRIGFDETAHFLQKFAEWRLYHNDADYRRCFGLLRDFVGMLNERDDMAFDQRVKEFSQEIQKFHNDRNTNDLASDTFTTLAQFLRIVEEIILGRLTQQNIIPLIRIIETVAKRMLKSNYIKFCTIDGCKEQPNRYCGLHELHDLSIVALMIFKVGLAKAIIPVQACQKICSFFGYAMVKIPKLDCKYALDMRKKTLLKIEGLKEICTVENAGHCVLDFLTELLKRNHAPRPCSFEWWLFGFAFEMASNLNAYEQVIVFGFIMIMKYYHDPSFPLRHENFAFRLKTALQQMNLCITPLDFKMKRIDLPDFGLTIPDDITDRDVLKCYVQLFTGLSDDAAREIIYRATEQTRSQIN